MKIHPLFDNVIRDLLDGCVTAAYAKWCAEGKPVVEESTAQSDIEDKHPRDYRDLWEASVKYLDAKDAEIERLTTRVNVAEEGLRLVNITCRNRNERIKELEKVRADLLVDRDMHRNKCRELEAKLAHRHELTSFPWDGCGTCKATRNAALEEAARMAETSHVTISTVDGLARANEDASPQIAARIRGMKK